MDLKRALELVYKKEGIDGIATAAEFSKYHKEIYKQILNTYGAHSYRRVIKELLGIAIPLIPGTDLFFKVVETSFIDYLRGLTNTNLSIIKTLTKRGIQNSILDVVVNEYVNRVKRIEKNGASTDLEKEVDNLFHSTIRADGLYLLHEHFALYKQAIPDILRRLNCDFKIRDYWIEVADCKNNIKDETVFRSSAELKESLKEKRKLYGDRIKIIIINPGDIIEKKLARIMEEAKNCELKDLVGEDFFNFRKDYLSFEENDVEEEVIEKIDTPELKDKRQEFFIKRNAWYYG